MCEYMRTFLVDCTYLRALQCIPIFPVYLARFSYEHDERANRRVKLSSAVVHKGIHDANVNFETGYWGISMPRSYFHNNGTISTYQT